MKAYKAIPRWWYYLVLLGAYGIAQASKSPHASPLSYLLNRAHSQLHRPLWYAMVDTHRACHHLLRFLRPLWNVGGHHRFLRVQLLGHWLLPDDHR